MAIQATLALRPVKPSIQSYSNPLVGFVHSLAALVPAPTQNTLFVEDPFAVRREFLSFLS